MKKLLPAFAVTVAFASSALAGESDFPAESARFYDGEPFSVEIPCVERAVGEYLDIPLDQVKNDDEGLIQGQNADTHVMVATVNPKAESNWEDVSWILVTNNKNSASVNHDGLEGAFIVASSLEADDLFRIEYRTENLEAFLKAYQCNGPSIAL